MIGRRLAGLFFLPLSRLGRFWRPIYGRMGGLETAILSALIVALLLFAAYFTTARRERESGLDPSYAREVYLYRPPRAEAKASLLPEGARRLAAALGSDLASEGQVAVYAAAGGRASGCGLVAEGRAVRLLSPAGISSDGCDPAATGLWLYGPKPRRRFPGVAPFSAACWFQPQQLRS